MWKIMLIDDETIIRRGLRQFIESSHSPFTVVAEAKNAGEALQQLDQLPAHVCFIDINMPNMNGLDLISLLHKRFPSMVVVIISGYDNFEYARQAVQLQAFDYVLKPVPKSDLEQLLHRLDTHLQQKFPDQSHTKASQDTPLPHRMISGGDGTLLIYKVTEYINDHYQDPELTITRVADLFHMNPTYLSKRMKQETGLSFLDYVTGLRIAKAKEVLDDAASNIRINSLATKVGYKSQYYFSRVFKNKVGLSPLEYKNRGIDA
ncbi:DNA-binding response regulator [Paenibacillus antibioticophila]|uniref:DNA-binding response regulator n=1 Tax=Paenibacillus antibioticophila TaxID=1274374 RepID=A0A919XSK7_9BACL|nr:response regulator [Paenibacillus antibioticophila]GIO38269.1 DNA-binding response regulator [Paenibacillus antibioticophila]